MVEQQLELLDELLANAGVHPIFGDVCKLGKLRMSPAKYSFALPWNDGGYVYASDTRIAVRQPGSISEEWSNKSGPAHTGDIFAKFGEGSGVPLPGLEAIESQKDTCKSCKGFGAFSVCSECHGTGENTCFECGADRECNECDGEGNYPDAIGSDKCADCQGSGSIIVKKPLQLDGVAIAGEYAELLIKHGVRQIIVRNGDRPVWFEIGDVEGALMPFNVSKVE